MRLAESLWSIDTGGLACAQFLQPPFRLDQPHPFNVLFNRRVKAGNQTLRKFHPISRMKSQSVSFNFRKGCMHLNTV